MARAKRKGTEGNVKVVPSSANVFADFGLGDAEELQTKVKIAFALNTILERMKGTTQARIAARLNTDQPKVSALKNYKLAGLSVERLLGFLTALHYDIDIKIKPTHKTGRTHSGRINVMV